MYLAQLKLSFSFDRYVCISHNVTFSLIWIVTLVYRAFIAVLKSHFDCYVNISRNFSSSLFFDCYFSISCNSSCPFCCYFSMS